MSGLVPNPHEKPTLTLEEAGKLLGMGKVAMRSAAQEGTIPVLKVGRRIVVPTAKFLEDTLGITPATLAPKKTIKKPVRRLPAA